MFPSIHPEAFGIVAAEAMASGLAIVSSGVGGAAEVFEDGISGLSFQAGNARSLAAQLERLWRIPVLLETLQKNGEQRARERFSVQRSAEDLETIFVKLKQQSPASRPSSVRRWSYIKERRRAAFPKRSRLADQRAAPRHDQQVPGADPLG